MFDNSPLWGIQCGFPLKQGKLLFGQCRNQKQDNKRICPTTETADWTLPHSNHSFRWLSELRCMRSSFTWDHVIWFFRDRSLRYPSKATNLFLGAACSIICRTVYNVSYRALQTLYIMCRKMCSSFLFTYFRCWCHVIRFPLLAEFLFSVAINYGLNVF